MRLLRQPHLLRSAVMFLRLFSLVIYLTVAARAAGQVYRYEAESGQRLGTVVQSSAVSGYSGSGYVTNFTNSASAVRVTTDVPNGLYELWVGYRSQYGEKGYNYNVDGVAGSGMFTGSTTFSTDRAGLFNLTAATNTMEISQGWGYYDVDYFEFRPYVPPTLQPIAPVLVDEVAGSRTQVLMNYLTQTYGSKTLSGQQHNASQNQSFPGSSYLARSGGLTPAIRGSDFIEYSPTRVINGSNTNNETEQSIAWAKSTGGVVSMMWHWNAPDDLINTTGHEWWRGFYSDATTFNLPAALANPTGDKYQKIIRDIDAIAVELKKFQDAGVPVIWRPLHEAQGTWFWWGAHGPDAFKQLWNLTYDRLTNHHGLHNLIWEFTSSAADGNFLNWYPGDDVVDMIGLDIYTTPTDPMSAQWLDVLQQYNGRKMIALSETGTLPDPTVMAQWGIDWSYFSPWTGSFIDNVPAAQLAATLSSPDVITLNELQTLPWKTNGSFQSADLDFNGAVDGADLAKLIAAFQHTAAGDVDGDGDTDGADVLAWQRSFTASQTLAAHHAAPEPAALTLLLTAICLRSRRK